MTRTEYLEWIQSVTSRLAEQRYPDNKNLQIVYQMGLAQRALADLCYIDSENGHQVNRMFKRNISGPTRPFQAKR